MGKFWEDQKVYFQGEHPVPGRQDRKMRLWTFETGFWLGVIVLMILLSIGPGGDARGVDGLPWFFASFFGLGVSYFTAGFGIGYALDALFPKKK